MSSILRIALCIFALCASAPNALAQQKTAKLGPVVVRYSEGTVHGFLDLRNDQGRLLARGDLLQVPRDSTIEARMVFRFLDGSTFEETTVFSQHGVFRMERYHLVQRGPAFREDLDAILSRDGHYVVETAARQGSKVKRYEGRIAMPADVYNGLPVVATKNLRKGDTVTVHLVAFMPKPRLIGLRIAYTATDTVMLGNHKEPVARFALSPQLGGLTKFFAKLLGKLPPDSDIWIAASKVPTFIRFDGPMYLGPVWSVTVTTPTWPAALKGGQR